MAISQSQRLRKAAAKAAKRKTVVAAKQAQERRELSITKPRHIDFAHAPYRRCVLGGGNGGGGMKTVVVARDLSRGRVAAVVFLVDLFCLGVKDVFFRVGSVLEFGKLVESLEDVAPVEDIEPPAARALVHDAVVYAASNGLSPAPEYEEMAAIFGDTPLGEHKFEFGFKGKPFYMPGPSDSQGRIRRVLAALEERLGPDGFQYAAPLFGFEDSDEDEDEDDDGEFEVEGQTIEGEVTAAEGSSQPD